MTITAAAAAALLLAGCGQTAPPQPSLRSLVGASLGWGGYTYLLVGRLPRSDLGAKIGTVAYHGSVSAGFTIHEVNGKSLLHELAFVRIGSGTVYAAVPEKVPSHPAPLLTQSSGPDFLTLTMTSAEVGWALVQPANGGAAQVERSTDGGLTWEVAMPPGASGGIFFFALSDQTAWVAAIAPGANGHTTVYVTRDGGASWHHGPVFDIGIGPGGGDELFVAADGQHGWLLAAAQGNSGGLPATLFRTSDGGMHWALASATGAANALPGDVAIRFASADVGFGAGSDPTHPLYATSDGGATWRPAALPPSVHAAGAPVLSGPNGLAWAALSPLGSAPPESLGFIATTDGGRTWQLRPAPFTARPDAIDVVNGTAAVAVTEKGTLYRTANGAKTWTAGAPPINIQEMMGSYEAVQISFATPQDGWMLLARRDTGMDRLLYRTSDGGRTWTFES